MITDKERKNREELAAYRRRELFRLMRENPELPVAICSSQKTRPDTRSWIDSPCYRVKKTFGLV